MKNDLIKRTVNWLDGYLERNETFEDFADDVNTLGGTFYLKDNDTPKTAGHIHIKNQKATIEDNSNETIATIPLKEIWNIHSENTLF